MAVPVANGRVVLFDDRRATMRRRDREATMPQFNVHHIEAAVTPIADDLRRTTGHELELSITDGTPFDEFDWYIDGRLIGGFGAPIANSEREAVIELVDRLCQHTLDELIWGGWPICPIHHTHPLEARPGPRSRAWWRCPKSGLEIAEVGQLVL